VIKSASNRADAGSMTTRPGWLRRGAAVAGCALLAWSPMAPAQAEDAAAARAQARAAAVQVRQISARLAGAESDYALAMSRVGQQVSDYVEADTASSQAQALADDAADRSAASVRALYLSGGQAGLLSSLLSSGDLAELTTRLTGVRQVIAATSATAEDATRQARRAQAVAADHQAQADASVVTAAQITEQAARVSDLLAEAQDALDRLSARARSLTEAEQAAAALAQARARAEAAQAGALASVRAQLPPEEYFRLYRAAATTCHGMDWTLLAAVGQVESGHGRNAGVSSAGAVGPMQFMPATFASYAVDGDHDGRLDPYSPADSVFTAARYLCSGGAGTPSGVRAALFRYNRAQWYVDLVLSVQSQLRAGLG
jgi:hypothetical protein